MIPTQIVSGSYLQVLHSFTSCGTGCFFEPLTSALQSEAADTPIHHDWWGGLLWCQRVRPGCQGHQTEHKKIQGSAHIPIQCGRQPYFHCQGAITPNSYTVKKLEECLDKAENYFNKIDQMYSTLIAKEEEDGTQQEAEAYKTKLREEITRYNDLVTRLSGALAQAPAVTPSTPLATPRTKTRQRTEVSKILVP